MWNLEAMKPCCLRPHFYGASQYRVHGHGAYPVHKGDRPDVEMVMSKCVQQAKL